MKYTWFLQTPAKLIRHFKSYYWRRLSINWFQNVPSFITILHFIAITGWAFLTLQHQIKCTTPDNPNNMGLTFSQKISFHKSDESGFLVSRHINVTENCKKACVAVLLRFVHIMTAPKGFNPVVQRQKFTANVLNKP